MDVVMMAPAKGELLGREGKHMAVDTSPEGCAPLLSLLLKVQIVEGREMDTLMSCFHFFVAKTKEYYDEHKDSLAAATDFTPLPKAITSHFFLLPPHPPLLSLPLPFVFLPLHSPLSLTPFFFFFFFAKEGEVSRKRGRSTRRSTTTTYPRR